MIHAAHEFQAEIRAFIEHGLWGGKEQFGPASFMGWATEAEGLVAGVAFHNWDEASGVIELSAYSARRDWCSRAVLREMMAYPFNQLGCRMVVARMSEKNARARRIWKAFGSTEVILPRMRGDDEDEVLAILHQDDWRHGLLARMEKAA